MHAVLENGRILIFDSYMFKETIKEISGRMWEPERKAWSIPVNADNIEMLKLIGCDLSEDLKRLVIHSECTGKEKLHTPIMPMPIKAVPYQHQISGYNFACQLMEIFGGECHES